VAATLVLLFPAALARALRGDPWPLLLDEPLAALDPNHREPAAPAGHAATAPRPPNSTSASR